MAHPHIKRPDHDLLLGRLSKSPKWSDGLWTLFGSTAVIRMLSFHGALDEIGLRTGSKMDEMATVLGRFLNVGIQKT
jgi:hypothetical protein